MINHDAPPKNNPFSHKFLLVIPLTKNANIAPNIATKPAVAISENKFSDRLSDILPYMKTEAKWA